MRDPDGALEVRGSRLVRRFTPHTAAAAFLDLPVARELVDQDLLVPFTHLSAAEIDVKRIEFVSAPFEWCDAQFRDAAELTLQVSSRVLAENLELKDASAWNVLFDGCRPIFCDHLSFRPIATKEWWAFGQFLRHFVFPLQISATTGMFSAKLLRMSRDGVQAQETKSVLGFRRFFTRVWPLLLIDSVGGTPARVSTSRASRSESFHSNLYSYCRWTLRGRGRLRVTQSIWSDYTESREHYASEAQQTKRAVVDKWLRNVSPRRVIDFGANTGEYTEMAVAAGGSVVAVEQDHECVSRLYFKFAGNRHVSPVYSTLGDLCGGAGWFGAEHSGLLDRLRLHANLVLMLALIHHLAVSESIPLTRIADLAAHVTSEYAIVELLDQSDPMLARLCLQRNRDVSDFSLAAQEEAFLRHFDFVARHHLSGTARILVLMQKKNVG